MKIRSFTAALAAALLLVAASCGDDGDPSEEAAAPPAEAVETPMIEVTVTKDSIEGVPAELDAGAVTVDLTTPSDQVDLNFTEVESGTTEDEFREGFSSVVTGGPFPDFALNNAGALPGTTSIELGDGSYFVWSQPDGDNPDPAAFVVSELTVVPNGSGDELPDTGTTITAADYSFDVQATAGDEFNFINAGPQEFHHAQIFDFEQSDPAAVEEGILQFLDSDEGDPPPPGMEFDPENAFAGGSGVFGPDGAGTGIATLQAGNTYAVVCFIQDRAGGPPHAFGNGMYEVFQVEETAG